MSSGNDKKIFVFALSQILNFEKSNQTVDCVNCFEAHDNFVEAIKLYQNKSLGEVKNVCITASRDKSIGIWNFLTGQQILQLKGHENWVKGIVILEQYDYLVSIGEDKTIRIWDLVKKKQIGIKKSAHEHFISALDYHE